MGFRTLVETLARGYRVRAIIRRAEQAEQLRRAKSINRFLANLETIVVRDFIASGAFEGALDGASGVIHVASPLPSPVSVRDLLLLNTV